MERWSKVALNYIVSEAEESKLRWLRKRGVSSYKER